MMMMMIMRVTHVHKKTASWMMCSAHTCGQKVVVIIGGLTKALYVKNNW
jgi:hypothetical protein